MRSVMQQTTIMKHIGGNVQCKERGGKEMEFWRTNTCGREREYAHERTLSAKEKKIEKEKERREKHI